MKHIKLFDNYTGDDLPSKEMIDWVASQSIIDIERSRLQEYFIERYKKELESLSYKEIVDIFNKTL